MEIEILKNEKDLLEFKIAGEKHTFPALLKNQLLKDSKVEFASYKLNHPMDKNSFFIVKTKGKTPKKALEDAVKNLNSLLTDLKKNLKKAA